jgi:hypothetical protein
VRAGRQVVVLAGQGVVEQAEGWLAEQTARARAGRFFLAIPVFLASATVPDPSALL